MDRAADGTEVLRDSTLLARLGARAAGALLWARAFGGLRLERAGLRDAAVFAFKRMDLRPGDGRFAAFLAAFFVALAFGFAFVAINLGCALSRLRFALAVRNCKCIAQKSQGARSVSAIARSIKVIAGRLD